MKQKWKQIYSSSDKIVWLNDINNEIKICYLTYEDGKTPLPKGWKRWFSTTYQLFYYTYNDNNGHKQIKWESPNKSNQYDYSPKIEQSRTIDLNLKDDLKKIYDISDSDISLIWNGNIIPCIVETVDDLINIRILGKDDCVDFSINKDKTAYINLLNVFKNNCPAPEKDGQGSFFLTLVFEICRQLEIKTLELRDESIIRSKDGLRVSLEFQSLMKYGFSWYERHGFSYKSTTKKDIVNKIRNTPISKIKEFLIVFATDFDGNTKQLKDKLKKKALENWCMKYPIFLDQEYVKSLVEQYTNKSYDRTNRPIRVLMARTKIFLDLNKLDYDFSELPSEINNTLRIIEEYEKDEKYTDSLSGFLTYVWDKNDSNNFQEYIDIVSLLYPSISKGKMYIDESILPAFPTESKNMIKVFSM